MQPGYTRIDYVVFAVLGVAGAVALLYMAFGWAQLGAFLAHQATVAWIQAIGSIAAVGAGAYGIWWQARRQEITRKNEAIEEQIRRLQFVGAALFDCRVVAELTRGQSVSTFPITVEFGELQTKLNALASIPALDLPDWRANYAITTAVNSMTSVAERILAVPPVRPHTHTEREKYLNVIVGALEFGERLVQNCLLDRASDLLAITHVLNGVPIRSAALANRQDS